LAVTIPVLSTAVVGAALGTLVVIDLYDLIGTVSVRFRFQKLAALPVSTAPTA